MAGDSATLHHLPLRRVESEAAFTDKYLHYHRAISLDDDDAWQILSDKYSRFIYYILHQFEIDQNDLDDVHQKVMVILMRDLKTYDRSRARFRNWLSMVIRSTCLMHYRERNSLKARQIKIENELISTDPTQEHVIDQNSQTSTYIVNWS